jgi:hypothetical protein
MQTFVGLRRPARLETWRAVVLTPAVVALSILGGLAAGEAAMGRERALLAVPFLVVIPLVYWRWPYVAPLSLLAAGLVIEEWTYLIGTRKGPITDRLPLFRTPVHGVILLPIEGIIIVALVVWVMRSALQRSITLPRSTVSRAFIFFWFLLLVGLGVGLARGAKFNFALWEIRPWLLMFSTYLLAAAWLTTARLLRGVLWVLVIATGFKGIEGTVIFLTYSRHLTPRPDAILGHEESLFFGIFILLTLGLWIYGQRGWLRRTATALLPAVVIADLANSRRTAWGILIVGALALLISAWIGLSDRRRLVSGILCAVALVGAVYFPLYWNHGYGTVAQPARAIRSQVSPDTRDASSDLYRKSEDANLILNTKQAGLLGKGFGRPIVYAIPIADISSTDPMIAYIPHNGLLWIWMRLGVQGEVAFWLLVGFAIIAAGGLAKADDKLLALFGALVICALLGYVLQGYEDQGIASLRIAPVMGCLLGALEAAQRLVPGSSLSTRRRVPLRIADTVGEGGAPHG